ncbi:glycosyltransferase family 2 protein [Serratia entomophila]|uniref:Glycosyltransferase family 2 protein n=1 Tax=Serratia entomophila TaxID=42906 RepID=A0ABY5CYM7_9GAMM|nr:glycosyltransferase family 2 protein [Serratia entomophila]USV02432.1 glycosyltransferase family 2 protein [Serratia entomophila]CAI1139187.1 putative glycosyl transferase [Serratia entomophila]CAI1143895.1 putative glycosyl transferase [Serratia entomophila]CAI1145973.1 putative glycosyl transferase [Serratia entomophila]CAI1149320.1 putative glycosyl transferase [Serratia entomophila]
MNNFALSVVITTYNRPDLLVRAVNSVVAERNEHHRIEIVVVDDASTTPLPELAIEDLVCHRMPVNGGPGPARMEGLALARAPWVLMLDDDDTLEPGTAEYLAQRLPEQPESRYPVYQFAVNRENQKEEFRLITFDDYVNKAITGDFTPVFDRQKFLSTGLRYPHNRAGGEHLLWWKIAEEFGIPSYSHPLVSVSDDAAVRLTHFSSQVTKAAYHQQLAEMALADFGDRLRRDHPEEYRRIRLAHITYSLLNNHRAAARQSLRDAPIGSKFKIALWAISWLPHSAIQKLFLFYRRRQG